MDKQSSRVFSLFFQGSLVKQILCALVAGILLAWLAPDAAKMMGFLGGLFISALKAVAPILVWVLVMASISNHRKGQKTNIRPILVLYLLATFLSALTAVVASFLFPSVLTLVVGDSQFTPPENIAQVINGVLNNILVNPVDALIRGNYIGILAWSLSLGIVLRHASDTTKVLLQDLSQGVTNLVRAVIRLAPIGIFGLVSSTIANTGFHALAGYLHVLAVLIGSMVFVALVVNPLMVFWKIRANPYPLVFACIRESGVTAFFTRSSAANIPVNMAMCRRMNLDKDTYSISIPLGASMNMGGAAITITTLTLATVHTLGMPIDIPTALLLSLVSAICACGASGVAGGSLLIIPLSCSLFGVSNDIAMQVVAVGVMIGVLQDSAETALNSSTDVLFTAAGCIAEDNRLANNPLTEKNNG